MHLRHHLLSALILSVGLPLVGPLLDVGTAHAGLGGHACYHMKRMKAHKTRRVVVVEPPGSVASVAAQVRSDAGEEDVPLVESDARLHGAATIAALPSADAELSLTVYDAGNTELASFSGRLGADGSVVLIADTRGSTDASTDCSSRLGCSAEETRAADIELLGAELFAAAEGHELGVDLSGADAYDIAYAELRYTPPCDMSSERGICVGDGRPVRSEVYWDEITAVWEAELGLEHAGLVDVKVKARDAEGETLETTKGALGAPWLDDGEGVNALGTDEDPLTTVGLTDAGLVVVSEGWSAGDELPTYAEVELTTGETVSVPANSYQRQQRRRKYLASLRSDSVDGTLEGGEIDERLGGSTISITGGSVLLEDLSLADLASPVCSAGTCVVVTETDAGDFELSVTAYDADPAALPDEVELVVSVHDAYGETLASEVVDVELDDAVTAVFAAGLEFSGDPVGLGLSGKVRLLGEADRRGRQDTLAKGKFYGSVGRDTDGDLALLGADKQADTLAAKIGLSEGGGDTPPAIQYAVFGNGSGTKNASSQTSTRPQLL